MSWDEIVDHVLMEFDKQPTPAILIFEAIVVIGTIVALWQLGQMKPGILRHYAVVAVGVLLFEIFTAPMWNNFKLGVWAYVYKDVSWVLTLEWSTLILATVLLVDRFLAQLREWQRFLVYLVVLTGIAGLAEFVIVGLGIRTYSSDVLAVIDNAPHLPIINLSLHALYYVPVFMSLVIAFYKYWVPVLDQTPVNERVVNPISRLVISLVGVFFFEVLIEPMVDNIGFPAWSYVFRDITILMTGLWVLVIWAGTYVVDRLLPRLDQARRFALYLIVIGLVAAPIEAWFINTGHRVYGPGATADFSGVRSVFTDTPIEVTLAIPLYLGLVIAFIRYWERITAGVPQRVRTVDPAVDPIPSEQPA
jgi:hypothetical protein